MYRRLALAAVAMVFGLLLVVPTQASADRHFKVDYTGNSIHYGPKVYCGSPNASNTCGHEFSKTVEFSVSATYGFSYNFFAAEVGWSASQASTYTRTYSINTDRHECGYIRMKTTTPYKHGEALGYTNYVWPFKNHHTPAWGKSRVYRGQAARVEPHSRTWYC